MLNEFFRTKLLSLKILLTDRVCPGLLWVSAFGVSIRNYLNFFEAVMLVVADVVFLIL